MHLVKDLKISVSVLAVEKVLRNFITHTVLSVFGKLNHQWQHLLYHSAVTLEWITQETC